MGIKCAQINMSRCAAGMNELRRYNEEKGFDIIMVEEPYAKQNIVWPEFCSYFGAKHDEVVWTITFIRETNLNAFMHVGLSNSICSVVKVKYASGSAACIMINSYLKFNECTEAHVTQLDKVLSGREGRMAVVSADANANSVLWHNPRTDENGLLLEDLIVAKDLQVINVEGSFTTYENTRG